MIVEDALSAIIARLARAMPELDPARLRALELDLRAEFGGERYYIAKSPAEDKAARLSRELARGATMAQAAHAAGVSLRHGRRLAARAGARRR